MKELLFSTEKLEMLSRSLALGLLRRKGCLSISEIASIPTVLDENEANRIADYLCIAPGAYKKVVRKSAEPFLMWETVICLESSDLSLVHSGTGVEVQ